MRERNRSAAARDLNLLISQLFCQPTTPTNSTSPTTEPKPNLLYKTQQEAAKW
jgi:hypothetical protein